MSKDYLNTEVVIEIRMIPKCSLTCMLKDYKKTIKRREIIMKFFRNKLFTGALALGLFVGGAGIATAATSTDYHPKMGDWFENGHNPTVMNTSSPSSVMPMATNPFNITQDPVNPVTPSKQTVKEQTPTQPTPPKPVQPESNQNNQYYCNDLQGHSYMNYQQHQEWHNTHSNQSAQPSSRIKNTNNITTNSNTNHNRNHNGQNHNSMGGNHHNGGHE